MAKSHIARIRRDIENSPGARVAKANKVAKRTIMLFTAVAAASIVLMLLKLDVPLLDVPGMAYR